VRVTAQSSVRIARAPGVVFDFVTRPEAVAETFRGSGPVPGAVKSELATPGGMRVGAVRRVESSDGSVVDEEIIELARPSVQAYRLIRGLRPPFTWLVREAGGRWTFNADGDGTLVSWVFTFELRLLAWPLARALLVPPFRRAMDLALAETKQRLEGAS
jgi:hypothetical protein